MLIRTKYYPVVLLSYLRSGSNWIASCIEQLSGILIGGMPDDTTDKILNKKCLIAKGHDHALNEQSPVHTFNKEKDGLILIVRNYKECITRHLMHGGAVEFNFNSFKKQMEGNITNRIDYISNLLFFEQCKNRLLIYYEDVLRNPKQEMLKILKFLQKYNGRNNEKEVNEFIFNVDNSKSTCYSNNLSVELKNEIDDYLEITFSDIFYDYLFDYHEENAKSL